MATPGFTSCSQCSRPVAIDSASGLCEVCLATAPTIDTPRASSASGEVDTFTRVMPAEIGEPLEAATRTNLDGTVTPQPAGETAEMVPDLRARLPESPPGYDLIRPLGVGGMGRVYLAREHVAERLLAIKFLTAPSSSTSLDRFIVEIRALARMKHPNIIEIVSADVQWREPFFTMEYAADGSLADCAREGRMLPPDEAARRILEAAEGVAFAHVNYVLHRDLKPSNIMMARSADGGTVAKVADFGLAKRTDRDDALTRTGALGTAPYMSPEAAAGRVREIGPASDVYGLGASLYHLLLGRPPFLGEDNAAIVQKVLNDPVVRPRSLKPELPAALEAIVMKCLEKNPSQRYASAAELAADLKRYLDGAAPVAPVLTPQRRMGKWLGRNRKWPTAIAAILLLAAGLVAATYAMFRPKIETEDAWLQGVQAKLKRGEGVVLLGETGVPKYPKMHLEANAVGTSAQSEGACEFHAFDMCLLELLSDPGIDRYRVTFEVKQLPSKDTVATTDFVGVYFGSASAAAPDGATSHGMLAVTWKDREQDRPVDPKNPGVYSVKVQRLGFVQHPNRRSWIDPATAASFDFRPNRRLPGEWRTVVLEATPEQVTLHWPAAIGKSAVEWRDGRPKKEFEKLKRSLDATIFGAGGVLPEWSPRMPIGVVAQRASVAVRNVIIAPLP